MKLILLKSLVSLKIVTTQRLMIGIIKVPRNDSKNFLSSFNSPQLKRLKSYLAENQLSK